MISALDRSSCNEGQSRDEITELGFRGGWQVFPCQRTGPEGSPAKPALGGGRVQWGGQGSCDECDIQTPPAVYLFALGSDCK